MIVIVRARQHFGCEVVHRGASLVGTRSGAHSRHYAGDIKGREDWMDTRVRDRHVKCRRSTRKGSGLVPSCAGGLASVTCRRALSLNPPRWTVPTLYKQTCCATIWSFTMHAIYAIYMVDGFCLVVKLTRAREQSIT